jgi:DNA repair protein RecN (Recombination protein N)
MLQLLNISNIALIDDLRVEFDKGLNLLTGETGSGKSIIVDALGVLIGGRFSADLLKTGTARGSIEGLFSVTPHPQLAALLEDSGITIPSLETDADNREEIVAQSAAKRSKNQKTAQLEPVELIIRREVSATGKNKIFINNQLATQSVLRDLRQFLVDIHGQGDQQTLFNPETHLELLDAFAGNAVLRKEVADSYQRWSELRRELDALNRNEAEKFQLVDTLKFQIQELEHAQLSIGEDERLEEERRRLLNVEKLTTLSQSSYSRIYEADDAALGRVRQTAAEVAELAEYESSFRDYIEGLESARAVLEDLAFSLRDFADKLEFSPARLVEIEDRLAELSRLKRKYGGSLQSALEHLARSEDRLQQIEGADEREAELKSDLAVAQDHYFNRAGTLHIERLRAAKKFEQAVERGIAEVAMENARFQVQVSDKLQFVDGNERADQGVSNIRPLATSRDNDKLKHIGHSTSNKHQFVDGDESRVQGVNNQLLTTSKDSDKLKYIGQKGVDHVEFYFSANVGEEVKPLARVASGGEASRLMLVLKTVANASEFPRTIVFDEIDTGIGGRVSEAVGAKLKKLSQTNQVLCVTHQPQIARFADSHLVVQKEAVKGHTEVNVTELDRRGRIEELARMLTGAEITESARRHARELLKY